MNGKFSLIVKASMVAAATLALSACFEGRYYPGGGYGGYGSYGYASPGYAYSPPVVYGDRDDYRPWRDRDAAADRYRAAEEAREHRQAELAERHDHDGDRDRGWNYR